MSFTDEDDYNDLRLFDDDGLLEQETIDTGEKSKGNLGVFTLRMVFNTNIAISLYRGEQRTDKYRGKAGLTKFDQLLNKIMVAAAQDDPYADQLIYDIHREYLKCEGIIKTAENYLQKIAKSKFRNGVSGEIKDPAHTNAYDVKLRTEIGKLLVWKIKEADELIRFNLFATNIGIITSAAAKNTNKEIANAFWRVLGMVFRWKSTGITRADIKQQTKRAIDAKEINKQIEISSTVFDESARSTFAPDIIVSPEHDIRPLADDKAQEQEQLDNEKKKKEMLAKM